MLKDDKEMNDAEKENAKKIEEAKGDNQQVGNEFTKVNRVTARASVPQKEMPEIPPTSSSLFVSSSFDEANMDKSATSDPSTQVKRKHDDQDEDTAAGSDQGKEKKRLIKDTQPSKKSSTFKEWRFSF
nr:hypothetical protein [Tanacetum cinerariifolium]